MEGEEREQMRGHEYLTYIWLTLVSIYEPSLSIKNEKTLTKKKEPSICLESLGTGRTNCTCYVSLSFSTLLSPPHNCYNIFSSPPDPTLLPKKKQKTPTYCCIMTIAFSLPILKSWLQHWIWTILRIRITMPHFPPWCRGPVMTLNVLFHHDLSSFI